MKFSDYKAHYDRYVAKQREEYERTRPESAEMFHLTDQCSRRYNLGMGEQSPYSDPQLIQVVVGLASGVPVMRICGAVHYEIHDLSELTALQFTKLAEIRRAVEQWRLGEIDELPPSGDWPPA